jgi:hypothetical protein
VNVGSAIARLVSDDSRIYWTEYVEGTANGGGAGVGGGVSWCSQSSCTGTGSPPIYETDKHYAIIQSGALPDYGFLAIDGGELYWTVTPVGATGPTLEWCHVPDCTIASRALPAGLTPRLVHDGVLYGTARSGNTTTLASCPAQACDAFTTVIDSVDVQSVTADGATLYVDAQDLTTFVEYVYACPLPCQAITQITRSSFPGFAVNAGSLYTAIASSDGASRFAACAVAWCPPSGPPPLDLPFTFVQLAQVVPAPTMLADSQGAYAYGTYTAPGDNVGIPSSGVTAIVYLPAQSP